MVDALVGLYLMVVLVGGTASLVGVLLGRWLRARWDRRHPERAAARQRARYQRRIAADWPLLAQTLGLGYRDQWTRQHASPSARFVVDHQGVSATVAAVPGAGLAEYQRAATYLADTWGCVAIRAEQVAPGLVELRGRYRDPLLAPARAELSGQAPASLTSWWLGWSEDGRPVLIRTAEVSGSVVAGLAGFGKTMLVAHLLGQLAPSPAVQFVLIDGKGGPRLRPAGPPRLAVSQGRPKRRARRSPPGAPADGRPPGRDRQRARRHQRLARRAVTVLAAGGGGHR
jgi:hypothetical protein